MKRHACICIYEEGKFYQIVALWEPGQTTRTHCGYWPILSRLFRLSVRVFHVVSYGFWGTTVISISFLDFWSIPLEGIMLDWTKALSSIIALLFYFCMSEDWSQTLYYWVVYTLSTRNFKLFQLCILWLWSGRLQTFGMFVLIFGDGAWPGSTALLTPLLSDQVTGCLAAPKVTAGGYSLPPLLDIPGAGIEATTGVSLGKHGLVLFSCPGLI